MYKRIMEIACENMMGFIHETNIRRFARGIAEECARDCEANGYDDAAKQIRESFKVD